MIRCECTLWRDTFLSPFPSFLYASFSPQAAFCADSMVFLARTPCILIPSVPRPCC